MSNKYEARWGARDAGIPPEGNVITRNLCLRGQWLDIGWHAKPEQMTGRDNRAEADAHALGLDERSLRLGKDSPAWTLGFEPIPLDTIGPVPDPRFRGPGAVTRR